MEFAAKKSGPTADALYDMLETNGEILPLIFEGKENECFARNALTVSDAVILCKRD